MGRTSLISVIWAFSFCVLGIHLSACSDDSSTSSNTVTTIETSKELIYNYELLRILYIYQDKDLGPIEDYIGKADGNYYAQHKVPWDYYDLYYMYSKMSDPYTQYYDPSRSTAKMNSRTYSSAYLDCGFEWTKEDSTNKFIITNIVKNSPADKAGLKVGDIIEKIDGTAPTNTTVLEKLSVGDEGDTITYTLKRDSTTINIPVVINVYYTPTVNLSFKDSIPIIQILQFRPLTSSDSGTYGEFMDYLHATEKYKATIIDLRDNGGGDLNQCFSIAKEMISKGDSTVGIVSATLDTIRDVQTFDTTFYVNDSNGQASNRYIVFLANGNSASCSEMLLQSVCMNKKSPIVGSTTYGKGIGQSLHYTPSYSVAQITTMKIIDKDFKAYHKYGIEPDFPISDDDLALKKAVELAKEKSYKRTAGYGKTDLGHFAKSALVQDTMPGFYLLPDEIQKNLYSPIELNTIKIKP